MHRPFLCFGVGALLAVAAICQGHQPPARPTTTSSPDCGVPTRTPSACDTKADAPRDVPAQEFGFFQAFGVATTSCRPTEAKAATPACGATKATMPGTTACSPASVTASAPVCRVKETATGPCCFGTAACGTVTLSPAQVCPGQTPTHGPACCVPQVTIMLPESAMKPTIDGTLAKLEALKARREAIEREERECQAVLKGLLDELQKRVNKVGLGAPTPVTPAPVYAPTPVTGPLSVGPAVRTQEACYYGPVTSYEKVGVYDKETGKLNVEVRAVTRYVLRNVKTHTATCPGLPAPALTPPCVEERCPAPLPRAEKPTPPASN